MIDRLFGDPGWLWSRVPHPVVLTGWLIARLDAALNRDARAFAARRAAGILALCLLVLLSVGLGMALARLSSWPSLGWVIEVPAVSVLLAQRSLIDHVRAVAKSLMAEGLAGGRRAVARIVGRDVTMLDEAGISRAAIESLAENFSDGLVAPAFWYALFGLPGLFLFKAVSTADSMIGHRSTRHEAFGWASARLDDLLNLIPSRLSALLIILAAAGRDRGSEILAVAVRDAPRHRSPNAGWPEAATAAALGIALGGPRRYGDLGVDGAWLNGEGRRRAKPSDIQRGIRLIDSAWVIVLVGTGLGGLALWLW